MIRWPVAPLLQIVRAGRGVLNGAIDFCSGDGLLLGGLIIVGLFLGLLNFGFCLREL